jgi:hypothetical protein
MQAIPPSSGAAPTAITMAPADTLEGTVSVYDPAMCCSTGVCGPGVDPALLQLARDLRWLEARGVRVERFGLAQEPAAFAQSPRVSGLLQAFGDKALPATLVNGEVIQHGHYPSRDALIAALSRSTRELALSAATTESTGPCCTPGSDCC